MKKLDELNVKIFADGADLAGMLEMHKNPLIKGFTTNPTLMRKAGVDDYSAFAKAVLSKITDRPVSFEVFADEFEEMERQALQIANWGSNVFVKIPITNTRGDSSERIVKRLSAAGVKLNITALLTIEQVRHITVAVAEGPGAYISLFAGRIADTGRDPKPMVAEAVRLLSPYQHIELIWASPRELLNIFEADEVGCHVITVTNDILKKLQMVGKDLAEYSLETVQMFYEDGKKVGYTLKKAAAAAY